MSELKDVHEAIALLKRAMLEKGEDYLYPKTEAAESGMCVYALDNQTPSCIVGHVAHYVDELEYVHETGEGAWATTVMKPIFDKDACEVLYRAQEVQDNQGTWGEAVKEAVDQARSIGYDV